MKEYTITVNGTSYDVTVEERGTTSTAPAPKKEAPKKAAPSSSGGETKIEAGAAGKVFKIERHVGDEVKRGETIVILEVMKMETPVVAPEDGVIATIDVKEGQSIEAGALLATMN